MAMVRHIENCLVSQSIKTLAVFVEASEVSIVSLFGSPRTEHTDYTLVRKCEDLHSTRITDKTNRRERRTELRVCGSHYRKIRISIATGCKTLEHIPLKWM
jgi:hypothetical protein